MNKNSKRRTLREMIQAGENQLPRGELSGKLSADTPKRLSHGEAELRVSEICDSILHRLDQPEQPTRDQERRRAKLDGNPQ